MKFSFACILVSFALFAEGPSKVYSHGNPTAIEQLFLEIINQARENPGEEARRLLKLDTVYSRSAKKRKPVFFESLESDLESIGRLPPLAFHPSLLHSAQKHCKDMVENNYLSHTNRKGKSPTDRAKLEEYSFGVVENIFGMGAENREQIEHAHFHWIVDHDNVNHSRYPFQHRNNLLNPKYTEIGIGMEGKYELGKITQNFGRDYSRFYLTGVVYQDKNNNGAYDIGEGLEGIKVVPDFGEYYAITSFSGGYAIPIFVEEIRKEKIPIEVKGKVWGKDHQKVAEEIRRKYVKDPKNLEWLEFRVVFQGGKLGHIRQMPVRMIKPIKIDYKLVQSEGLIWDAPKEDPFVVGENFKLDLSIPPIEEKKP